MYSAPSASHTRAPWPRVKKRGVPPTARNARTGELTPPGIVRCARAKSSSFLLTVQPRSIEHAGDAARGALDFGQVVMRDHGREHRTGVDARRDEHARI